MEYLIWQVMSGIGVVLWRPMRAEEYSNILMIHLTAEKIWRQKEHALSAVALGATTNTLSRRPIGFIETGHFEHLTLVLGS